MMHFAQPFGRTLLLLVGFCLFLGPGDDWGGGSNAGWKAAAADEPTTEEARFFESEVRPLLAERCFKCHGVDKQRGDLRLDSRGGMLAGGESGPALSPGDAEGSLLLEAVRYESFEMPPDGKLADAEIEVLTRWVKLGAPWPGAREDAPPRKEAKISDEDRAFWSFQPLQRPQPPAVEDAGWGRNPIDQFVLAAQLQAGLQPAPVADRVTLIRRATLDLLGIPPTPEEVRQFLEDESPQAYASLIDRLLERPEYGERWARHWLDLVRYAESDGFRQDAYRPAAWRYRDYVIRSFNEDKPYDRFVQEQLAGDELWPGEPEAMVATALLRHGIYEYNQRDVRTQWQDMLNDITDVTADVFLGLGLSCARCHDHKFDPLLQEDYYRLQAFFTPLLPRDDLPLAPPAEVERYQETLREWEQRTAEIRREMAELEAPVRAEAAEAAINKFPLDIRPMLRKLPAEREPLEQQLAELANRQVVLELERLDFEKKLQGEQKERWVSLGKQLAEHEQRKPKPLPAAFTVTDVGPQAPPTMIPGKRQGQPVEPGFLTVLNSPPPSIPDDLPNSQTTGRRTALARWLTRPDHPLTSRVIVNRVWQQHFGRGLVATSSDFGTLGERPSHPELLDWLATEFVDRGWSFKHLHRLIMNSATYQQTSLRAAPERARMEDPENRLLWKMPVRRLDAEQIRDSLLAVSGELKSDQGGPSSAADAPRRSIYTKVLRNSPDPLLASFDGADGFASRPQRNVTTTPTQSLLMINGQWTLDRAQAMARRVAQSVGAEDAAGQVRQAFWLAYGRPPGSEELAQSREFLEHQREQTPPRSETVDSLAERPGAAVDLQPGPARQLALAPKGLPRADAAFTVEALVLLRSMYPDASVRTIAAQWNGSQQQAGWSLGVTSAKSAYRPRNLILQLVGETDEGKVAYEVVASNLHLELNQPYYVAVVVRPDEPTEDGVTFHVQPLDGKSPLQTANAAHRVRTAAAPGVPFTLGGRVGLDQHQWDGIIDEVRLTAAPLAVEQLLVSAGRNVRLADGDAGTTDAGATDPGTVRTETGASEPGAGPSEPAGQPAGELEIVGHWTFDDARSPWRDASPRANHLTRSAAAVDAALVDLCHALMNSNEFLYVD